MGSEQILILFALVIAAAVLPPATPFQRYSVGDLNGWTTGVDYETWAKQYEFHVGDQLNFLYFPDKHNVFKVNETRFQECIPPPDTEALTSGNDGVYLTKPGKHWFMCGVYLHCLKGMKVEITVLPDQSATPPSHNNCTNSETPSDSNSAYGIAKSFFQVLIVAVVTYLHY